MEGVTKALSIQLEQERLASSPGTYPRLIDPVPPIRDLKAKDGIPNTVYDAESDEAVQAWAPGSGLSAFNKTQLEALALRFSLDTTGTVANIKARLEALPPAS